jgi:hypothetical protein
MENYIGSAPCSRSFHSMIYLNDRAWLFGGKSINNLNDVKSLKIVDDSEKYWKAY